MGFNIHWNFFFSLKSSSFFTKQNQIKACLWYTSGLTRLALVIYTAIIDHRPFCFAETFIESKTEWNISGLGKSCQRLITYFAWQIWVNSTLLKFSKIPWDVCTCEWDNLPNLSNKITENKEFPNSGGLR